MMLHVACVLLLCRGPGGKSIRLVFRRPWVRIPAGPRIFSGDLISFSLCIAKYHIRLQHTMTSVFFQLLATTRVPRGSHRQMNLKDSFFFKEEGEGEIGGSGWG